MTAETGWTLESEPPVTDPTVVTLFEQTCFCRSGRNGDIDPRHPEGLFLDDTRIVSEWRLTVNGGAVEPLSVISPRPFTGVFVGRAPVEPGAPESTLVVERHRFVGSGMREDVVIRNLAMSAMPVDVVLTVGSDFADLFEVKACRVRPPGQPHAAVGRNELRLHRADGQGVRVLARSDVTATLGAGSIAFTARIEPHESWTVSLGVDAVEDGVITPGSFPLDRDPEESPVVLRSNEWHARGPELTCGDSGVTRTIDTTRRDLDALRVFALGDGEAPALAAGSPWYMAVFGRDSLFASLMALPLDPSPAYGTLETLARHQGSKRDRRTEEEPGRMLHEIRNGREVARALGGTGVYYGAVDTTPMFVVLLAELARWGLSERRLDELVPAADRALEWVQTFAEGDPDGFVAYRRPNEQGLVSQGWKDSPGSICFADGRIAEAPVALCEVQAYVYAAYLGRAGIARIQGDEGTERRWREAAARFREAFNRRFWLPERGWYAVALDGTGAPVDSLTSNIGHCLWSGIADDDKARQVADHLVSPAMFTGWGVRTLASTMTRYNPMSYHRGCVWPWDTAVITAGLMRYGFVPEATLVATGLLAAANEFGGRLPEVFSGFGRDEFEEPVPFPASCSPQAWSSATPLYVLRTLLRFGPDVPAGTLRVSPVLPEGLLPFRLSGIPLGTARITVEVDDAGVNVAGAAGVRVVTD